MEPRRATERVPPRQMTNKSLGASDGSPVRRVTGCSLRRSLVRRSPTGACQCSRVLAIPRNPRSSRLATPLASSTSRSPDSSTSSCSGSTRASPRRTTAGRPRWRSPPGPGRCGRGVCVVENLLVDPSAGSLHPGGEPVDAYRLAGACHFHQPLAQVGQGGDEGPVGLAVPEGGQWTKQQVQAVADLGLGDPPPSGRPAGTTARPTRLRRRRPDGPPRPAAGCRLVGVGGVGAGGRGDRPARRGPWRAATTAGSMTTETGPPWQA
jgi:hypothetical protein